MLLSLLVISVCRIDKFPLGGRNSLDSVDFSYFEYLFLGLSGSRFLGAFPLGDLQDISGRGKAVNPPAPPVIMPLFKVGPGRNFSAYRPQQ